MRLLAVAAATAAAWVIAGGDLPPVPRVGSHLPPLRLIGPAAAAGTACAAIVGGLSGVPVIAAATGAIVAVAVASIDGVRRRAAAERTADRWPDFLAAVRADLAAGMPLAAATVNAGRRVGGRFAMLAEELAEHHAAGGSFAVSLREARDRWRDPLADRVFTTLAAAAVTGGHRVAEILAALSESVADELRLRRAHHAATTQQRLTAAVALAAPWILLVLTTATNPQAADALTTPTGRLIVVGGFAATGVGYVLARRAARLSRPPRVFR